MIKYLLSIFIVLVFTSCIPHSIKKMYKPNDVSFSSLTHELARPLCDEIKENSVLFVTDFVNETDLKNKSQLGFLLSNELKVNILNENCTSNISIKELQLSKHIKIGQNGTRILTRQLDELKSKIVFDDKQVLVGTYIITNKQIILFLKLIDLNNALTIASSSTTRDITPEITHLEGMNKKKPVPYRARPMHL